MDILYLNTSGCYVVIFTAKQTKTLDGYANVVSFLRDKLRTYDGFLGLESVDNNQGNEITVSYWKNEDSIRLWKKDKDHLKIRNENRHKWYSGFKVRIAKIEREYTME